MMEILLFHVKLVTGGLDVKLLPTHKVKNSTKKERIQTKSKIQEPLNSFYNSCGVSKNISAKYRMFWIN